MSASVERVFLEALDDLQSGRAEDVDHYLERVPQSEREQLADLLAMYFASRRGVRHGEVSSVVYTRVLATLDRITETAGPSGTLPGLLAELRRTRGLRRSDVTRAVCERLGLADQSVSQLEREYHRLETGQLDGRRLSRRILEALAEIFRIPVDDLAAASRPLATEPPRTGRRFARSAGAFTAASHVPPPRSGNNTDPDVRALFYGGRDA
jgi:transcriptional regulator with XRE-family HTH domain